MGCASWLTVGYHTSLCVHSHPEGKGKGGEGHIETKYGQKLLC